MSNVEYSLRTRTREYGAEVDGGLAMELALPFEDDAVGVSTGISLDGVIVNTILSSIVNGRVAPNPVRVSRGGFESSAMVMSKAPIGDEGVEKSHAGRSNCPLKATKSIWDEFEL
jgi:hypothetical protein